VCPGTKFRLEASGWVAPAGQTVRKPCAVGLVTVTFRTTAEVPEAGTPPWPATGRGRGPPAPIVLPSRRVSSSLAGCRELTMPSRPTELRASPTQPATSKTTSTLPAWLKMLTCPLLPRATSTRLGTVRPGVQLRLETVGWGGPTGQMLRKLEAVVSVTVTLRNTAETSAVGTPPRPATWTLSVPLGPMGATGTPPLP